MFVFGAAESLSAPDMRGRVCVMTASGGKSTVGAIGGHAVVMGAGFAGLFAARVLSDWYRTVTVVERDVLPDNPLQRKGIPQGRHLHGLLSRGSQALEELFPGILSELVVAGAHVIDDGDMSRICTRIGQYGLNRADKFADPAALTLYLASRPFLEFHIRRRVNSLGNVSFVDGCDAVEPILNATNVIAGVRVASRNTGEQTVLEAALVVDAMGRAARTPALLSKLGSRRPVETRSTTHATYSSQLLSMPEGCIPEKLMMAVQPGAGKPRGALMAHEHGAWILTVGRLANDPNPPTDLHGMVSLVEGFVPPSILAAVRTAETVGDVAVFRYTGAVWRRYDLMENLPVGLLVVGDALCSLNPIYGQGVTMAALQALVLRDCLRDGDPCLPQRFFAAVADHIKPVWEMNEANDRAQASSRQWHRLSGRFTNWMMNGAMKAAENDIVLTETFYRVTNLVDPPGRLREPSVVRRMMVGNLRRHARR